MALAPVRPFRAWDFGDHVGVRVALDKAPHSTHPEWTKAALAYLRVRHVRTNADSPAAVTAMKALNRDLGVRFHFTSSRPARNADEAAVKLAVQKRAQWVIAQGLKPITDSIESFNEWDGDGAIPNLWMKQLGWAQKWLWAMRDNLRA